MASIVKTVATLAIAMVLTCMVGCSNDNSSQPMEEMSIEAITALGEWGIAPDGLAEIREDIAENHICYLFAIENDGVVEQIKSSLGAPVCTEKDQLPQYDKGVLAKQLHNEEKAMGWTRFVTGDGEAKTKTKDLYITTNADGETHLYVFN